MTDSLTITPKQRRKISVQDIQSIADLTAQQITEKGACLIIGIRPQSWYDWKGRNGNEAKYSDILSRVRESKIKGCLETIDKAGDTRKIVTRKGDVVEVGGGGVASIRRNPCSKVSP